MKKQNRQPVTIGADSGNGNKPLRIVRTPPIKLGVQDKINAKARAMVNTAMVNIMGNSETLAKDSEIIEVNAAIQAATLLSHRRDISRYRNLATQLLTELEVETNHHDGECCRMMPAPKVNTQG